jgi:hypothetical protein
MATYKVIQDIEAEDHFIGPLTFKQFIFAGIATILLYVSGWAALKHFWVLPAIVVAPMAFLYVLAWPWSRDQTTEVWLLARLRFYFKPHLRIWDQSGMSNLVTVTAPKTLEKIYTNNLSQSEVHSRLQALSQTLDSRGWAIKNVNVNLFTDPAYATPYTDSDRLVSATTLPAQEIKTDVSASDDVLDEHNNPVAQRFDQMTKAAQTAYLQQAKARMQQAGNEAEVTEGKKRGKGNAPALNKEDLWFMQPEAPKERPDYAMFAPMTVAPTQAPEVREEFHSPVNAPPTPEEQALLEKIRVEKNQPEANYHHLRVIKPRGNDGPVIHQSTAPDPLPPAPAPAQEQAPPTSPFSGPIQGMGTSDDIASEPQTKTPGGQQHAAGEDGLPFFDPRFPELSGGTPSASSPPPGPVTTTSDPVILQLAHNDDLNVATLAHQANKAREQKSSDDEVVVSISH